MTPRSASWRWPVLVGSAWIVLLFLMVPTLVSVPVSLTPNRYLSLPRNGLSLQHYTTLLGDESWRAAIGQSLGIGVVVMLISVALGTGAAIGLWRISSSFGEAARLLVLAPLIVPPVVSALAFYRFFATANLLDSFTGVIIAHTVLATPYVLVAVSASLATIDPRQEQASRSLGGSSFQTIGWVILPQAMPGVLAGSVFAFLCSWDEIVVTLFVAARTVYTLPRKMWDGINDQVDPTIASAATFLFLVTVLAIGLQVLRSDKEPSSSEAA